MKRFFLLAAGIAMGVVFLAGCYNHFARTDQAYEWSSAGGERWPREAMFLSLHLLPVYGVALPVEGPLFDPAEFRGGDRRPPLVAGANRQAALSMAKNSRRLRIDFFEGYHPEEYVLVEPFADGQSVARDERGRVVMTARTLPDGSVLIRDAAGEDIALHEFQ